MKFQDLDSGFSTPKYSDLDHVVPVRCEAQVSCVSNNSREQVGEAGFSLGGSLQLPARMLTLPGVKPAVGGELVWTPDLCPRRRARVVQLAGRGAEAVLGPGLGLHGEDFGQTLAGC